MPPLPPLPPLPGEGEGGEWAPPEDLPPFWEDFDWPDFEEQLNELLKWLEELQALLQ
jgi:hypothetical protein